MKEIRRSLALESELNAQLSEIERRIGNLVAERSALQRLLVRVHNQNIGGQKGARRNSYDRLVVENKILGILRSAAPRSVPVRELHRAVLIDSPRLKDVTFRSYLHRLKERALIVPDLKKRGHWLSPEQAAEIASKSSETPAS